MTINAAASLACHAGLDPASMTSWIAGQARNDTHAPSCRTRSGIHDPWMAGQARNDSHAPSCRTRSDIHDPWISGQARNDSHAPSCRTRSGIHDPWIAGQARNDSRAPSCRARSGIHDRWIAGQADNDSPRQALPAMTAKCRKASLLTTLWSVPAQLSSYPPDGRKCKVVHIRATPPKQGHAQCSGLGKCLMKKGKIAVVHSGAAPLSSYYYIELKKSKERG
jgi:hypothetical protein